MNTKHKAEKAVLRYTKYAWLSGICGILMLTVGIVMPIVLLNYIKTQAQEQVVMTSSNYGKWGQIPGDTGLVLERKFTFFNFTNPEDFFVRGSKPHLQETNAVYYQECLNFTDPKFSEDQTYVDYKYQAQFFPIKNTTGAGNSFLFQLKC